MADALKGGLITSAFPVSPTDLDTANNTFRMRLKPGREPKMEYVPMIANAVVLKDDFLKVTQASNSDAVERTLAPAGSAGATLTGDSGGITRYIAAYDLTATASVDENSVIGVYDVTDFQFLFRLYHATASSAQIQDIRINVRPQIPVGSTAIATDFYEWGWWEIGTGSDNYQPIVDVANQDSTNGGVAIVAAANESDIADNFGLVWVEFSGLA